MRRRRHRVKCTSWSSQGWGLRWALGSPRLIQISPSARLWSGGVKRLGATVSAGNTCSHRARTHRPAHRPYYMCGYFISRKQSASEKPAVYALRRDSGARGGDGPRLRRAASRAGRHVCRRRHRRAGSWAVSPSGSGAHPRTVIVRCLHDYVHVHVKDR